MSEETNLRIFHVMFLSSTSEDVFVKVEFYEKLESTDRCRF